MANSNPPNIAIEMKNTSKVAYPPPSSSRFFMTDIILRFLATVLSIGAIAMMISSNQSTHLFGMEIKARYTYSSAYRFSVGTDVIVCVCSVLSMAATLSFSKLNLASHVQRCNKFYLFIFLHDLVLTALSVSGCSAATAIGYVALHGQDQTGWNEICSRVNVFCNKVMASLALSYAAFLCFFALSMVSFIKGRAVRIDLESQN